jgi:DNA helicase-2/ATP-dependent DNA helicase PcrA
LFLFDQASIGRVVPEYTSEVRAHWGGQFSPNYEIWAVASRHSLYRPRGEWPKSLVDYCPDYRAGTDRQRKPENLCAAMRQASILHKGNKSPADILELVAVSIADLLRRNGLGLGENVTPLNVWRTLAARKTDLPLRIRRLVRDRILHARAAWSEAEWQAFCAELQAMLDINPPGSEPLISYLEFNAEGALDGQNPPQQASRTLVEHNGVQVRLGSIHSVKGRTVDAILVVETEVWRGPSRAEQAMDLTTVLPHAFGVEETDFNATSAKLGPVFS